MTHEPARANLFVFWAKEKPHACGDCRRVWRGVRGFDTCSECDGLLWRVPFPLLWETYASRPEAAWQSEAHATLPAAAEWPPA